MKSRGRRAERRARERREANDRQQAIEAFRRAERQKTKIINEARSIQGAVDYDHRP